MIELDSIPRLRGEHPVGTQVVKRKPAKQLNDRQPGGPDRRTLLRSAVIGLTTLGFSALGVIPAARRAYADGYEIYYACPSYAANHNCSPGCGPSTVDDQACRSDGWHRSDSGYNYWWYLRPNECYGDPPWADGWTWRYDGSCLGCLWIEYRCHDGWLTLCVDACWSSKTICRWIIGCGSV